MKRENFGSRLGFLLVSVGCAVGIGNVWKFPYVTGANGGGVFVLFYLLFLFIMGVPVLTMELAVGRASGKSAVLAYKALEKPGSRWHIHGWFCVAGCALLMMYYTTVSGWMLGLLFLIAVLAVHSLTLPGAGEGVRFYLLPDLAKASAAGLGSVITAAMNQAFFTLSLGIAAMEVFGSYMSREHTLTSEAVRICALDTFVALMAGLIIFPACFSFGVQPDSGPSLIFMTLPKVFLHMAGGRLWGTLFFLFMTFASFSTVIAVFENLQANSMDNFGWSRRKAALMNGVFILLASFPCVLGFNLWSGVQVPGIGDIQTFEDFLVSNLLLPLGSLVYLLFCVTKWGWGFENYLAEANTGKGLRMPRQLKIYFRFFLPVLILVILIQGLWGFLPRS